MEKLTKSNTKNMSTEANPLTDPSILRYASVWEDIGLLYEGLSIDPADDVLSITSAGDNVLNLLLKNPGSITAVDGNAAQNALLELKMAGIACLDHAAFLSLLGITDTYDRATLYSNIAVKLKPDTKAFWDERISLINEGLIQQGKLEQYFSVFQKSILPSLHHQTAVEQLLAETAIEKQRLFFNTLWNTPDFAQAFKEYFSEANMSRSGRDPVQFRYVAEDAGSFFYDRFCNLCMTMPLKGNFYVYRFLTGTYRNGQEMPPYLLEANYMMLREGLPKIRIVTNSLLHFLEQQPDNSFSKGNLSNLFEYLSPEETDGLLTALHRTFRPEGILAYWNLLVTRHRPEHMKELLHPLKDKSFNLWLSDRAWFYRDFVLEQVKKRAIH